MCLKAEQRCTPCSQRRNHYNLNVTHYRNPWVPCDMQQLLSKEDSLGRLHQRGSSVLANRLGMAVQQQSRETRLFLGQRPWNTSA